MCSRPDIIVLGFQEIVPLTAQQIVQTDPEKRLALIFSDFLLLFTVWALFQATMGEESHGQY